MKSVWIFGQETEAGLRGAAPTLAKHLARAERGLRLNDVVALALGIFLGIHEGEDPLLLVGLEVRVAEENGGDGEHRAQGDDPLADAGDPEHGGGDGDKDDGGAEVRLNENQSHRQADDGQRRYDLAQAAELLGARRER
jgi:hypothetical protein